MPSKNLKCTGIVLNPEDWAELKKLAAREERSVSWYIRRLVREGLQRLQEQGKSEAA